MIHGGGFNQFSNRTEWVWRPNRDLNNDDDDSQHKIAKYYSDLLIFIVLKGYGFPNFDVRIDTNSVLTQSGVPDFIVKITVKRY